MNNKKPVSIIIILIVIAIVLWLVFHNRGTLNSTDMGTNTASSTQTQTGNPQTITEYVRQNIAALSPIMPSLGGSWYVTNIEAHGGAGTVTYEDGHTQVIADFTYEVNAQGVPRIISFTPRQ